MKIPQLVSLTLEDLGDDASIVEHYIKQLQARVVELEQVVCAMMVADETGYVDGEGYVEGFDKLTETGKKLLAEHDVEVAKAAIRIALRNLGAPNITESSIQIFANEYAERVKRGVS